MSTHSAMKHYRSIGTLILAALACLLHAQGPDNPYVTDCNCPIYVSVTPDSPEKNGIIKLKPTKEGMITISVTATPPPQGAIVPTFRLRQDNGKEVASASGWTHTFNLSTLGLKFPLVLETLVDCPNYSTDGKKICDTKKFSFGGCETGNCGSGTCQSGVGQPSGDIDPSDPNPFHFELGIGSSFQGDESKSLHFNLSPNNPISVGDFKVHSVSGYAQAGNTITTDTTETTIANGGGGVTVQIKKAGTNDVFRKYQFNSVTSGGTQSLTLTETRCTDQTIVHTWTLSNGVYSFSTANGLRTITKTIEQDANFIRIERHKTFELVSGQDVLVADERLHYQTFPWGERLVMREIPVATNPITYLTTVWSYGDPSDGYGYGKLKSITRYDGSSETHTYGPDFHQVDSSYDHQEKTTWAGGNTTYETRTNGILHARTVETISGNIITLRRYTSASQYIETTTTHVAAGNDFGNQPVTITHPDGTTTSYAYSRTGGNRITTVSSGKFTSGSLTDGTTSITTVNAQGQTIESITTDVPSQIVIAHTKALQFDGYGRPTTIGHFPSAQNVPVYSVARTYTCCKLTSQTDIHGVTTDYQYDLLGRQTIVQSLGVAQQTIYKGLTTTSHRYPVGQSATTANRIAESVTNLAGTTQESWQPDTASATAGALVKTTTTTIYKPSTGLSRRVVTTMPDNHTQVSDYLIDGRMYETYTQTLVDITTKRSPHIIYSYTPTTSGLFSARAFVDNGTHREIVGSQNDWAGRTLTSGRLATLANTTLTATTTNYYQTGTGFLLTTTDPDGVINRFAYNPRGEREITVLELNNNTTTEYGVDQVTRNRTFATTRTAAPTVPVLRTEVQVWQDSASVNSPTTASYIERTPDGLLSWSKQIGVSTEASAESTIGLNRTETSINPDGTKQVQQYTGGRPTSTSSLSTTNVTILSNSFTYDSLNRPETQTDSRTGTTTTFYLSTTADVPASITDPGNRTTSFTYDNRGRRTHVDAPNTFDPAGAAGNTNLTNITVTAYNPDGTISSVTGAQTYPVSYTYDYAQRMKTMTTTSASGNVITAWNYSTTTGQLLSKRYNSNSTGTTGAGPSYTYTNAGRLKTRTWARGNHTRYDYNSAGHLSAKRYFLTAIADTGSNVGNDPNTGDVTYSYDSLSRNTAAVVSNQSTTRPGVRLNSYFDTNLLRTTRTLFLIDPDLASTTSNGTAPFTMQRNLHRKYDSLSRSEGFHMRHTGSLTSTLEAETTYRYSATNGRFAAVSSNPIGGSSTDTHDFHYGYETNSNLVKTTQSFTNYNYTSNSGTAIHQATRTFEATRNSLDLISNTNSSTNAVLSASDYSVNQIGQRDGIARSGSATPGSASAAYTYNNRGELISADEATNTADRAYQYDAIGNREKTIAGSLTLPSSNNYTVNALNQYTAIPNLPATPSYDDDGNATAYPLPVDPTTNAAITYDGENRQIKVVTATTTVEYLYDAHSRRVASTIGSNRTYYIYDGWNCVAEFTGTVHTSGTAPALTRTWTHTWGLDLSQSSQGAGGVGGLLASSKFSSSTSATAYYPLYDGNGNITAYINNACAIQASFDYDPFGNITNNNNTPALPYAFSTKPLDVTTGLYYYGYRWYDPLTGRWTNRDPIEENGGANLYGNVNNSVINFIDLLGLDMHACARCHGSTDDVYGNIAAFGARATSSEWQNVLANSPSDDGSRFHMQTVGIFKVGCGVVILVAATTAEIGTLGASSCILPFAVGGAFYMMRSGANEALTAYSDSPRTFNLVENVMAENPDCDACDACCSVAFLEVSTMMFPASATRLPLVYRVESSYNTRLIIGPNGEVSLACNNLSNNRLFLNFGDKTRALEYYAQKAGAPNLTLKTFKVRCEYLEKLKKIAIPELGSKGKGLPTIVDPTRASNQYGLPKASVDDLMNYIIQGSGKVLKSCP